MFFFSRGVSAFFNQFFKWLFWNKTGQKILFSIVIFAILIAFVRLGEVSAVEEVEDINYKVKSYYDGVVNDAILRIENNWDNLSDGQKTNLLSDNVYLYFYYGTEDGSSYNNAVPVNNNSLRVAWMTKGSITNNATISNYDYMGVTGYTMYLRTGTQGILFTNSGIQTFKDKSVYIPQFINGYIPYNWYTYISSKRSGDTETIIALLEDINESLSNTTPDQETEDSVVVDSSAVDSISTASVDNVFSSLFTTLGNKFNSYDLSVTESWVWNLMGTRITFYSDTIYKVIKGTFMETLITSLWLYITGHYAFAWLSKLIHSIKDGSILNGIEMNEVLTKEIL